MVKNNLTAMEVLELALSDEGNKHIYIDDAGDEFTQKELLLESVSAVNTYAPWGVEDVDPRYDELKNSLMGAYRNIRHILDMDCVGLDCEKCPCRSVCADLCSINGEISDSLTFANACNLEGGE